MKKPKINKTKEEENWRFPRATARKLAARIQNLLGARE
jgi:hypothetical protein